MSRTEVNNQRINPVVIDDDAFAARDALLKKIYEQNDLPALGLAVSRVVQRASSDDEATGELAQLVLSDVGLTQKILRVSNTVFYRASAGVPVTTVSRAIFLLGFDTVKTIALAMLLVEGLSGERRQSLQAELNEAFCAGMIGRELARRSHYKDPEEAAVAALFRNMGRILVAIHDHRLYERIAQAVSAGVRPEHASMQVLGCTFDMLGQGVLNDWKIPERIVQTLKPLAQASGPLKVAAARPEWLQQVAAFAADAAAIITRLSGDAAREAKERLLQRYGIAFEVSAEEIDAMFALIAEEAEILIHHAVSNAGSRTSEAATASAAGSISAAELAFTVQTDKRDDGAATTAGKKAAASVPGITVNGEHKAAIRELAQAALNGERSAVRSTTGADESPSAGSGAGLHASSGESRGEISGESSGERPATSPTRAGDSRPPVAKAAAVSDALPDDMLMLARRPPAPAAEAGRVPLDSCAVLLAGVQDITAIIASGRSRSNEVLLLALETLQRSFDFRFATVCLHDAKQNCYRARLSLGEGSDARAREFLFTPDEQQDLFQRAMKKDVDVVIADASDARVQALLPGWHRRAFSDTRSFLVLPIVVQQKRLGFFYADRVYPARRGLSVEESALVRTLKGVVLASLEVTLRG